MEISYISKVQVEPMQVQPVLALKQQESIKGVIPWMQLKRSLLCNIVSTRRTPLYPSVKDNAVCLSPISFFSSASELFSI